MQLVSFDIFRTLGLPNTLNLKAESFLKHRAELQRADWVLFPEYWQLNALIYGLGCRVFPSQASYLVGHDKTEMVRAFTASVPHGKRAPVALCTRPARPYLQSVPAAPATISRSSLVATRPSVPSSVWSPE